MNLGEFHAEVRSAHKRGNALDERLSGFVRRAARFIEQNWTLQYMRQRFTLAVGAGADEVLLTGATVKAVELVRFVAGATTYTANKVDQMDLDYVSREILPTQYFLNGTTGLVFNKPFTEAVVIHGSLARYSLWPVADGETHWLLDNAEGLLLRQALLEIMADARDERGFQAMLLKREEDIKVLLNADYEARYAGQSVVL